MHEELIYNQKKGEMGVDGPGPCPEGIDMSRGRQLVDGDRETDYGHPVESHKYYALAWSAILRTDVTPKQVALCMASMKLVREGYKHKADNLDDTDGYVDIARRIAKYDELNR